MPFLWFVLQLSHVWSRYLRDNQLSGTIPNSISSLTNLRYLYVANGGAVITCTQTVNTKVVIMMCDGSRRDEGMSLCICVCVCVRACVLRAVFVSCVLCVCACGD